MISPSISAKGFLIGGGVALTQSREKKLYHVFSQSQALMGNAGIFCFAKSSDQARAYFIDQSLQREVERNREYYTGRIGDSADLLFVEYFMEETENGLSKQLSEEKAKEWFKGSPDWAEQFIRYHRRETDLLPDEMLVYIARKDALANEVIYVESIDYIDLDESTRIQSAMFKLD